MPSRGLITLALITAISIVACSVAMRGRYQTPDKDYQEKVLVFPTLQERINRISTIEVLRSNDRFVLSRSQGNWINPEIGGFPALVYRIENTIVGVAALKYIAPKTKRAALYPKLAVEDVTERSKSTRLIFKDNAGTIMADVIIGKQKGGFDKQNVYIRRPADDRSWLAEGSFDVGYDAIEWSDSAVINFDADSINTLEITKRQGERVVLYREQPHSPQLSLKNLPVGAAVAHQHQIDYLAGLLQQVSFIEARRTTDFDSKVVPIFEVVGEMKSQLVVTLRVVKILQDGSAWIQIASKVVNSARVSSATIEEDDRINSKFDGWIIRVPRKFTDRLRIQTDDIIERL